jgi:UDP-N-acetylmuramoyl-tripeptide--D-alanyl-D-alanine ligase
MVSSLTLADVIEILANTRSESAREIAVSRVVVDSRQVIPGSIFVALQGENVDGHRFIGEALTRGAIAVIAEARARDAGLGPSVHWIDTINIGVAGLQPSPSFSTPIVFVTQSSLNALQQLAVAWRYKFACKVIGVTGSVGKSSTKELIAAVLRQKYRTLKNEGNLNSESGLPMVVLQMNDSYERAVLEMGMYGLGEIRELCRIARPSIGVVTNVGPSHLERLGSIENIAEAKSELVQALPADGVAILNGDDERVLAMRDKTRAHVFTFGTQPRFDLWAGDITSHALDGLSFTLHYHDDGIPVRVPLVGRHNVYTALAAVAVGLVEGMTRDEILRGLQDVSAQLRLVAIPGENGTMIIDDTYNASPASTFAALDLFAELAGRKVAVLGDMYELGSEEAHAHKIVGERAAKIVDVLIAVGPRGKWIGEAAQAVGLPQVLFAENNARAIDVIRNVARAGDVILVKGSRGLKMEEIVREIKRNAEL